MGGQKILVDPILVGNLDFGIPWLYDAAKKVLKNFQVLFLGKKKKTWIIAIVTVFALWLPKKIKKVFALLCFCYYIS